MIMPIRLYTDPILHVLCKKIEEITEDTRNLADNMIQTMLANKGVGLAANQVGISQQLCVMHVEERSRILVLVNPELKLISKEKIKIPEGCLSAPGLTTNLKRPKKVVISAKLLTGEDTTLQFTDFDARIALHELGHLYGHMISDSVFNFARFK